MQNLDKRDMDALYDKLLEAYKTKTQDEFEQYVIDSKLNIEKYVESRLDYENFIPYPSVNDEDFNKKIYLKKEFNRNKSVLPDLKKGFDAIANDKCSQNEFLLSDNQKFVKNILSPLTPYNGLLVYHGVGLGKTACAINIAEEYYDIYKTKILAIMSDNLFENFKKQIFDVAKYDFESNTSLLCTGTRYTDMIIDKENLRNKPITERNEEITRQVNRFINERYEFVGYLKLAYEIRNIETTVENEKYLDDEAKIQRIKDRIRKKYSNRLIIIDEAHNLRADSPLVEKITSDKIVKLLEIVDNAKLLLMTATPMFNSATEIVWLLNLLLINDRRKPLKNRDVFETKKRDELKPGGIDALIRASTGYVSFMRGENPFSFPFRLFPSINSDTKLLDVGKYPHLEIEFLEIVQSRMSSSQRRVYDKIHKTSGDHVDGDDEEDGTKSISGKGNISIIQLSNVVYSKDSSEPSKTFGRIGFNTCFKVQHNKFSYKDPSYQILAYDKIKHFAPKIKTIVDYILRGEGLVFVYSRYYWSGIYPLALALEHVGFNNIDNNVGIDITIDRKTEKNISDKYVMLTNDLTRQKFDQFVNIIRDKDNKDGKNVRVILATSVASEGLDFRNIREVHLLEPWYNLNKSEQVIGRAVRNCSHIDLPKEKRNVTIYFHASTLDANNEQASVDLRIYSLAEKKQKNIFAVEDVLRQNAIDCHLNKDLLSFPIDGMNISFDIRTSQKTDIPDYKVGDRDYSLACNFKKCVSKCSMKVEGELDESTFDKFFVKDDIERYKRRISKLYANVIAYGYDDIVEALSVPKTDEEILAYALDEVLKERYVISSNRGMGRLIYKSDKYIFQSDAFTDTKLSLQDRSSLETRRHKVEISELARKAATSKPPVAEQPVPTTEASAPMEANIITKIYESYIIRFSLLVTKTKYEKIDNFRQYIIDSIIDSLDIPDFIEVMNVLAKSKTFDNKIFDNVKSKIETIVPKDIFKLLNGLLDKELSKTTPGTIRELLEHSVREIYVKDSKDIFYAYHNGKYYLYHDRNNIYLQMTPSEENENKTNLTEFNKKLKNKNNKVNVWGYVERVTPKKSAPVSLFKIKTNQTDAGFVCKSGPIAVGQLPERINKIENVMEVDGTEKKPKNLTKASLCDIYEIVLRSKGDGFFERPILTIFTKN